MTGHPDDPAAALVEERLRDALDPLRTTTLPDGAARTAMAAGARRRRVRRAGVLAAPLVAAAVVAVTVALVGVVGRGPVPAVPSPGPSPAVPLFRALPEGTWVRAAASPLSPRQRPVVAQVGGTVLVLGGTDETPCPPNASCVGPPGGGFRADGAAYDPATDRWRRIADAPVTLQVPVTAIIGDTLYLLTNPSSYGADDQVEPPAHRELLAYSVTQDRWTQYAAPLAAVSGLVPVGGGRLLAHGYQHSDVLPTDMVLDVATRTWSPVAEDPFRATVNRQVLPDGNGGGYLVAMEQTGHGDGPWRVAHWDPATDTWTRLPDPRESELYPSWFGVDGFLVDASGQAFDPAAGAWRSLPRFDPSPGWWGGPSGSGAGRIVTYGGVLDVRARRWTRLPDLSGRIAESGDTVTTDGVLLKAGGVPTEGKDAWRIEAMTSDLWMLRLP